MGRSFCPHFQIAAPDHLGRYDCELLESRANKRHINVRSYSRRLAGRQELVFKVCEMLLVRQMGRVDFWVSMRHQLFALNSWPKAAESCRAVQLPRSPGCRKESGKLMIWQSMPRRFKEPIRLFSLRRVGQKIIIQFNWFVKLSIYDVKILFGKSRKVRLIRFSRVTGVDCQLNKIKTHLLQQRPSSPCRRP